MARAGGKPSHAGGSTPNLPRDVRMLSARRRDGTVPQRPRAAPRCAHATLGRDVEMRWCSSLGFVGLLHGFALVRRFISVFLSLDRRVFRSHRRYSSGRFSGASRLRAAADRGPRAARSCHRGRSWFVACARRSFARINRGSCVRLCYCTVSRDQRKTMSVLSVCAHTYNYIQWSVPWARGRMWSS